MYLVYIVGLTRFVRYHNPLSKSIQRNSIKKKQCVVNAAIKLNIFRFSNKFTTVKKKTDFKIFKI